MAFDACGNVRITLVSHVRRIALTPERGALLIQEHGDAEGQARRDLQDEPAASVCRRLPTRPFAEIG
jgi:hypothetical protein